MKKFVYTYGLASALVVVPLVSMATEFVPLTPGLPFLKVQVGTGGLVNLINNLVGLSVAVAAVLAVIMVAIGGFKYMTTDSMFAMGSAKEQITNAIVGLLIVLAAILILETINPKLVEMNLFKPMQSQVNAP